MFKSKIVFVVGAGASNEVGLPIGADLKNQIADKINISFDGWNAISGDREIMNIIQRHSRSLESFSQNPNDYLHCAWQIRDAMPQASSIDTYLDAHRNNRIIKFCGKLGIVKCILEAERSSELYIDHRHSQKIDLSRLTNTWFAGFFQLLSDGISITEIDSIFDNVSFINFNYDRCIEQYLFAALQNYYSLDPAKTTTLLRKLKILRPYGSVGALPMQDDQGQYKFGSQQADILALTNQIKTFSEQIEDEKALNELSEIIQHAKTIVFLGFAFHPQNMELLKSSPGTFTTKNVFATAYGVSQSDCDVIESDIIQLTGLPKPHVHIQVKNNLKCAGLFNEYRRSLTA